MSSLLDIIGAMMAFCPRCGKRLQRVAEPAECESCGWREHGEPYNCGSNYCDDPTCTSNRPEHPDHHPHPEVL